MPTLNDMMEVADLFRVDAIEAVQDHCVAVRNRNSSCTRCVDVCLANAISVGENELSIDGGACVNCGACVGVCPTSCLAPATPPTPKVREGMLAAARAAGGVACAACARKAAKHEADPDLFAEVPCLAHMTEGLLLDLCSAGADDIVLVDGDCATCKYGQVSPAIDATVENALRLAEAMGASPMIARASMFPPELAGTFKRDVRGADRRGLMSQTGSYLRTVAGNVAQKTIDEKLGPKPEPHKERFKKKEKFAPEANMRLLDDMLELGEPPAQPAMLDTRRFGDVRIDADLCSACGLCVLACPTDALKHAVFDEPADPANQFLEFQTADCTQCMLCRDVCLRRCIQVGSQVSTSELFDFEPRLIEIPRPHDRMAILEKYKH